jgi:hypothetical protein
MLGLKDNQPALAATVSDIFEDALRDPEFPTSANHHATAEKGRRTGKQALI